MKYGYLAIPYMADPNQQKTMNKNNSPLTLDDFEKEIVFRRRMKLPTKILHWLIPGDREVIRHGARWRIGREALNGMIKKTPEQEEIKYFFTEAAQRNCDLFLDVGASIGYYSILAARMGIFKEIHALEPIAKNFTRLQWHIQANDFDDVIRTYRVAASDSERKVLLVNESIVNDETQHVEKTKNTHAGTDPNRGYDAQAIVLNSLFDFKNKNLAIKMDIEYHELPALRGAGNLLANNYVFLQVEIHPGNTKVINYLLKKGFRMLNHLNQHFYFDNSAGTV